MDTYHYYNKTNFEEIWAQQEFKYMQKQISSIFESISAFLVL